MSRYRGPRLRIIRRIGDLPGLTSKVSKRLNPPGQHGSLSKSNKKFSPFQIRLKEKQKLRYHYGITEQQLLIYVKKASSKKGVAGRILLTFLEMRLDNIVFRLGFAPTLPAARQLVSHKHILLNNKVVNIPSHTCRPKDLIKLDTSLLAKKIYSAFEDALVPQHLLLTKEKDKFEGKVLRFVHRKSISLVISELLIIEYYSRKI